MTSCDECGKVFNFPYLLKRHLEATRECGTPFNIKFNFDIRIKKIEENINNKIQLSSDIKCFFCNKEFSKKYNTFRHIKEFCKVKNNLQDSINKLIEERDNLIKKCNK